MKFLGRLVLIAVLVLVAWVVDRLFLAPIRLARPSRLTVEIEKEIDSALAWTVGSQPGDHPGLEVAVKARWMDENELYVEVRASRGGPGFQKTELWLSARKRGTPRVEARVTSFGSEGGGAFWPVLDLEGSIRLGAGAQAFLERDEAARLLMQYSVSGVQISDIVRSSGTIRLLASQVESGSTAPIPDPR